MTDSMKCCPLTRIFTLSSSFARSVWVPRTTYWKSRSNEIIPAPITLNTLLINYKKWEDVWLNVRPYAHQNPRRCQVDSCAICLKCLKTHLRRKQIHLHSGSEDRLVQVKVSLWGDYAHRPPYKRSSSPGCVNVSVPQHIEIRNLQLQLLSSIINSISFQNF